VREVVIASAARTPIGRFMGGLSSVAAPDLGAHAIRAALERARVPAEAVEEVIMGCVVQAGIGQNPARQAAIKAGVPTSVGAVTINKVCGSGLKAVVLAAQAIKAGDAEVIVAGGMESMSNAPHLLPKAREGFRLGHAQLLDSVIRDGLWDVYNDVHMGETAELVAAKYGITREAQDEFALRSHKKAVAAQRAGKFEAEIAPLEIPQKKGAPVTLANDEGPRADTSLEALAKLRPAFRKEGGTVTAGNAPGLNDGAAALVVMSGERARASKIAPLARITGYATGGRDPQWVMLAPIDAVKKLLEATGRRAAGEYDLVELNEAFAAAAIAVSRELEIPPARLNVNGGAIALGHPIGASGARILTTLLYAMKDRGARTGLAALCLGGGNAVAMSVER
jgi:acetyl-CoA C-acetyltransferase